MSHFAKVLDGSVLKVIVAEPDFFDSFVDDSPGDWIQCSYNTRGGIHYDPQTGQPSEDQSKALRKNFPAVGFSYDTNLEAFVPPKPHNSWILNETSCLWEPPVAKPAGDGEYTWDESTTSWKEYTPGV